jgi:hypothetical protein
MREMGVERVRQTNLAIRQLVKVPVCKHGRGEIVREPVIDIWTDRLDCIKSQR